MTVHSQRLEISIATAALLLFLSFLYLWIRSAEHPVAATGVALQTLAGFFATVQLWANSPSDSVLRWCARQVEERRWGVAGLLDGHLRSLLLALAWYLLAGQAFKALSWWGPPEAIGWPVAIGLLLVFVLGVVVFLLAIVMFAAVRLSSGVYAPRGKALATLHAQLKRSDWLWPIVGSIFLLGGVLQVIAA